MFKQGPQLRDPAERCISKLGEVRHRLLPFLHKQVGFLRDPGGGSFVYGRRGIPEQRGKLGFGLGIQLLHGVSIGAKGRMNFPEDVFGRSQVGLSLLQLKFELVRLGVELI